MLFTAKQTDHPPPYAAVRPLPARVPSLLSLCVRALAPFPDQVHRLPVRLHPRTLPDLVPADPALLDPRLWAVIVQIFEPLPAALASYRLPLADPHLPLLQAIPSTPAFSLVTLLSLPGCVHLTDDSIGQLRMLHTLSALDASATALTPHSMRTLAATLQLDGAMSQRGPWQLRILSLRNCRHMTSEVLPYLLRFPLLSVIDLRATRCLPSSSIPFQPCSFHDLYHPASLATALSSLCDIQVNLFSSPSPAVLNIDSIYHPKAKSSPAPVTPQDAYVVISSDRSRISVGNSIVLENQIQARDNALAHQQNKAAWYDRQVRLESPGVHHESRRHASSSHYHERRVGETGFDHKNPIRPAPQSRPTLVSYNNPSPVPSADPYPPLLRSAESAPRTRTSMDFPQPSPNTPRPGTSTDQFYQPIPRVSSKEGNPTSSLRLERRRIPESLLSPNDGSFDDRLRLYRPPLPWSTLEETLLSLREQETRANQERERQRRIAAAEKNDGALAMVDKDSARAARVKRELERVVEEAAKRRKVVDVEDEIEQDDSRLPLPSRYSRSTISAIPMSNLSISSTPPPQPLVNESTTKNPFRRRHRSFPASAPVLGPAASTSTSPSGVDNDSTMQASATSGSDISADTSRPRHKPLVPISSLVVPTLTPEMKEDMRREATESNRSKKIGAKVTGNVKSPRPSSGGQFDWKSWGKPA